MTSSKSKIKKVIDALIGLLALAKWIPFLGKWRELLLALSAVLATVSGLLAKCDETSSQSDQLPKSEPTKAPEPTPLTTPIRTPTASPTPSPEIIVDRIPEAGWPFTVRYTAKFEFNTFLWADKYKLQVMGQEHKTGFMVAPAVVLNNPGPRKLTVRNLQGDILAEKMIEVRR
jgi:hypothetical protein